MAAASPEPTSIQSAAFGTKGGGMWTFAAGDTKACMVEIFYLPNRANLDDEGFHLFGRWDSRAEIPTRLRRCCKKVDDG